MRAIVIYESMFGSTHRIAEAVAEALGRSGETTLVAAGEVTDEEMAGVDLLVVGAPTHAHRLPTHESRLEAEGKADQHDELDLDPAWSEPGVRELLDRIGTAHAPSVAAFDTRVDVPTFISGRASKHLARELKHRGCRIVGEASFLVDRHEHLVGGEVERAAEWASALVPALT